MRITMRYALAAAVAAAVLGPHASAQDIKATFQTPAIDRWMYPFNATPGYRPAASTFGSTSGEPDFDNRDAQIVVSFDTAAQVPPGEGRLRYAVSRATLELEVANDLAFVYDASQDPWTIFVPATDPEWTADADPGQPVECFGVGFRNGWTASSFEENSPYCPSGSSPLDIGVRNAFAASVATGSPIDVSNTVRERYDPAPFATGVIDGLEAGALVPIGSTMRFELDVKDPAVRAYVQSGLNAGDLHLAVTSLTFVEVMGGQYPSFVMKEHALVAFGLASPPTLTIEVTLAPACAAADFNCDGSVGGADLGMLLSAWGQVGATPQDLNGDGVVGGADLGMLLGAWG